MKEKIIWAVFFIVSVIITYAYLKSIDPSDPGTTFFTACFISAILSLIVPCAFHVKWRYDNGVDLFASLESDPEKVKTHMLFIMQWGHHEGIVGAFKEFNTIFRNYPQWKLQNWKVFRAWYKDQIDHMIEHPDIYGMTMKADGSPYSKDKDPLYDPQAPDWALFDRDRNYDDDDDDVDDFDDDDFDYYGDNHKQSKAGDAFCIGVGIGLVNGLTGGSVFGSGSSGSAS